jgi:fluoride ion exporter CrcB/FEX
MQASRSSIPPNENHDATSDGNSDSVSGIGINEGFRVPLHSQFQEQQESLTEAPLTPRTLYIPQPRDETEARESFRRGAIDKAHEDSALSWPEHIQNHDVHRFRNATTKLRPRSNSTTSRSRSVVIQEDVLSDVGPPTSEEGQVLPRSAGSFHSFSARSTLRKRRRRSYSDLRLVITADASALVARPSIFVRDKSQVHEDDAKADNKDIEIIAAPAPAVVEIDTKDTKPSEASAIASAPAATARDEKSKGKEPSPGTKSAIVGLATWEKYCNRHVQLLVSLALFSYLGQFARYFIENLFGKACHDPETIGWDPWWRACTSSPGTTDSTGGAFFTDLPTNVIGCFLMGLLVSGDGESISVNLPMAALPRNHFFQNWVVTHVGLRTGFCGALTTFASWNTQMVVMLCGSRRATALGYSQWVSALWGYLVGFYAALQSYQFGVAVAFALSRWYNPDLAREADRIIDKKAIGVLIHRDLPDFERRFLHSIVVESHYDDETNNNDCDDFGENLLRYGDSCYESYYDDHIHHLRAWKEGTDDHRHGFRGLLEDSAKRSYVSELHEIEKNLLVHRIEPRQKLLEIARDAGWDVQSLKNWTSALTKEEQGVEVAAQGEGRQGDSKDNNNSGESNDNSDGNRDGDSEDSLAETLLEDAYFGSSYSSVTEVGITLVCFLVVTGLLLMGFIRYSNIGHRNNGNNNNELLVARVDALVASSYRTQFLSSLVSPLGTYSRWYLSRLNGKIQTEKWEWLPIGTLLANLIASSISALCAGLLLGLDDSDSDTTELQVAFVKAIQVGFAGSCSTVSTFCTETTGLLRALPRAFWGYYYGFGSMVCALLVAFVSYAWAVI